MKTEISKDKFTILLVKNDKRPAVIVWNREDYIKEQVPNDLEPIFTSIHAKLEKIRKRGLLKKENVQYFEVKDPRFARFYLLPKIHKQLYDVPGRLVISNCGYYTENISALLDFYVKSLAQTVKLYIKETNDFLNKLRSLLKLPSNIILYTVDVVGVYLNIQHKEGLSALGKRLDNRKGN